MKSTNLHLDSMPGLSLESFHVKDFMIEPLLVVGVSAFWLVMLALVTASLITLKVWDTLVFRPTPLLLRRQLRTPQGIIQAAIQILDLHSLRSKSRCWSWP